MELSDLVYTKCEDTSRTVRKTETGQHIRIVSYIHSVSRLRIAVLFLFFLPCALSAQDIVLRGRVVDPQGSAIPNARVQLIDREQVLSRAQSAADGKFLLKVRATGKLII